MKRFSVLIRGVNSRIILQLILLSALSVVSAYPAPDFKNVDWDIVLFLTPVGILKNLTAASPVLRSFYLDISTDQVSLSPFQLVLLILIVALLVWNGLSILRSLKVEDPKRQ